MDGQGTKRHRKLPKFQPTEYGAQVLQTATDDRRTGNSIWRSRSRSLKPTWTIYAFSPINTRHGTQQTMVTTVG